MNLKFEGLLLETMAACCKRCDDKSAETKKTWFGSKQIARAEDRLMWNSQSGLRGPIGPDEMIEDLISWLCRKDDLWHSQARHLADE